MNDDNLDLIMEVMLLMKQPAKLADEMAKPNSKINQLMDAMDVEALYDLQDHMDTAFEQEPKEEKPPEPVIVKDPKDIWDVL